MNPVTGAFLGPQSSVAIGTLVPGTGSATNGVFAAGNGITETNYKYPWLGIAPRIGAPGHRDGDMFDAILAFLDQAGDRMEYVYQLEKRDGFAAAVALYP